MPDDRLGVSAEIPRCGGAVEIYVQTHPSVVSITYLKTCRAPKEYVLLRPWLSREQSIAIDSWGFLRACQDFMSLLSYILGKSSTIG